MSDNSSAAAVTLLARVLDELVALRGELAATRKKPVDPLVPIAPQVLLDVKDAATYCRVSSTTIYRAAERGDLRCMRAGSRVRFSRVDLDAWMRGERHPGRVLPLKQR